MYELCLGSSKYGMYQVWWRLDEICQIESEEYVLKIEMAEMGQAFTNYFVLIQGIYR